jgi:hypothetical protein
MARSQVADRGTASPRQATKGVPPAWGWAWGQSLSLKNKIDMKIRIEPRTWTDSLDKRPSHRIRTRDLEHRMLEVCIGQVH